MERLIQHTAILVLALSLIAGCTGMQNITFSPSGVNADRAEFFFLKAQALSQSDQLQSALHYLTIARELSPDNRKIGEEYHRIRKQADQKADRHFKQGVIAFQKNKIKEATTEFIKVLYYYPRHRAALDYLRNRIHPKPFVQVTVSKDDTPESIAQRVYRNKQMAFLVHYLMADRQPETKLQPARLLLPLVPHKWIRPSNAKPSQAETAAPPKQESDAEKVLRLAQKHFQKKEYQAAINLIKPVTEKDSDNPNLARLYNTACFEEGQQLFQAGKLLSAKAMLAQVDPAHTGLRQLQDKLAGAIQKQAALHYRRGVRYFMNEDLKKSIQEWDKTLALEPDHKKAIKARSNARQLLKKLEGVK